MNNSIMINCETTFTLLRGRMFYLSMLVVMAVIMIFISACHREEKKQNANLQALDTLDKETNQKIPDASVIKPVFPGGDTFQQGCEFVQDQAEILLEEYYRPGKTGKRLREISIELENMALEWKEMDCQQVFGFMVPEIPRPPHAGKVKEPVPSKPVVK